jgi:two-component system cell cycle sensor histidine kinase/response regulator CckA
MGSQMRNDPGRMLRFTQFAVDNLGDAAYCIEEDASIVYVNDAACHMLGYSREELLSMRVYDIDTDVTVEVWSKIWDLLRQVKKRTMEGRHRTKDGRFFPVEISANLLLFEGVEYSCAFVRDISERRELELRLRQSEKMKAIGQLAGGVAHDFNNQLTGVSGFADLLSDRLEGDATAAHYVDQIQMAVRRAASLTQQLLTFARQENQISELVDLNVIAQEALGILERSIDKKIVIVRNLDAQKPTVLGDASRLQSAILNLALNAGDAMPRGGQLSIRSETVVLDADFCARQALPVEPGSYVMLEVGDDGEGMTREVLDRLYEPFFTTKERGRGTGLGLSAVYGAVKSHRGTIEVRSEVAQGTVVRLYLPVQEGASKDAGAESLPIAKLAHQLRVMVVEDEEPLRAMLNVILKSLGCEVVTFENGAPAADYYRTHSGTVDLVVLDMRMPVMDGTETFHALRAINPSVKVLLASGYSVTGAAQALLQSGARGFVQKPYRRQTLVEKIQEVLASGG